MQIIIDNCVVSQFGLNTINIKPISLIKNFDITKYKVISTGSRKTDNDILHKLSRGSLTFDDLVSTYIS